MGYRKRASSLFSKDHSASSPVLPAAPLPHSSSPQSDPVSDSRLKALVSGRQRAVSGLSSYSTQSDDDISDAQKASDVTADFDPKVIPPELAAIIALSSAHQSRCYYEGRFVFLRDLDNDGKPPANRIWQDVYGQLVGTVLSIFDSRELDGSGNRAAVKPTYINISDASFRLIDSIPSSNGSPSIKNVIALSTTFKNRFLLQFSSKSTMLLWTAALRLSLFESVALQEAYTGALLAARGSRMNGIRHLLQETKFKHQDFAVVRFGVGMPWTRCWAVVTPAGYKKRKANKTGRIDFFESQKAKQKKHKPLATVTAAKACYAVYPESSLLINQSTLFKIEGTIAVHDEASKGTPRDGFIFIMPELHPGVYGFETLIRFLIPTLDSFGLYGRPQRFNADKNDMRSIMFGLPDPPNTRYLDLADVHDVCLKRAMDESWRDDAWRTELKKIIVSKMQTGTRNVHRTLPSEPEHSTPPIPQGEMINKSLSEQMNSLSIRRPSPQKFSREPPAELLPPVNLAAGRASSDYEDALPSPVAPVSAAAAAAEMEASPGRVDDEDYSDNIIDGYDDDAAVDEPDVSTLARDRAGSSASKELLRQYYVEPDALLAADNSSTRSRSPYENRGPSPYESRPSFDSHRGPSPYQQRPVYDQRQPFPSRPGAAQNQYHAQTAQPFDSRPQQPLPRSPSGQQLNQHLQPEEQTQSSRERLYATVQFEEQPRYYRQQPPQQQQQQQQQPPSPQRHKVARVPVYAVPQSMTSADQQRRPQQGPVPGGWGPRA